MATAHPKLGVPEPGRCIAGRQGIIATHALILTELAGVTADRELLLPWRGPCAGAISASCWNLSNSSVGSALLDALKEAARDAADVTRSLQGGLARCRIGYSQGTGP